MSSNRRSFVMGTAVLTALASLGQSKAQTPEAPVDPRMWGGMVKRSENATLITWMPGEPELPGPPGWVPISVLTMVTLDETYVFAELQNVTGAPALAPRLNIEVLQGDFSFGLHELPADTPWVDAESTAFYYGLQFFGNSLENVDWDGMNLSAAQEQYRTYGEYDMSGLVIQDGRLVNNRDVPVGPVYMKVFLRDKDAVFIGGCSSMGTGANTPPSGGSVKLGDPADPTYVPGCGFSMAGIEASEELGIGEPYRSEYRLVGFE